MSRSRLHRDARASAVPDPTQVIPRPPPPPLPEPPPAPAAEPPQGPPVLMCAIAAAAEAGTGPEGAARLAATLVYMDLKLAIWYRTGQLGLIDEADADLHAGTPPRRRTAMGQYRRESAALLRGGDRSWVLPGTPPGTVARLYEEAAAVPAAGWYQQEAGPP